MKLKVIKPYTDKQLSKNMVVGTEFEVNNERAKILIDKDFCIPLEEIQIEEVKEIKPKQTRKRKTK